jgi:fumarate reductase subunit D
MNDQNSNYTSEQLGYGVLSYLSIFCLVPILMKKEDDFIKFHAKQGLMLFIVEVAIGIIGIIPFLGGIILTLGVLLCGLVSLAGIVQVLMGNKWSIPVISEWSEKFKI